MALGLIFSRAAEILKTVFSSRGRPIICSPIGSLFLLNPAGTDAAGKPAKFIGKVNGKYPHQGSTSRPSISFMVSMPGTLIPAGIPGTVNPAISGCFSSNSLISDAGTWPSIKYDPI